MRSAIRVAGATSAKAGTEGETTATGLSGGEGEDILMNTGILRVGPADGATGDARWMSLLDTEASSFGFAGSTNAESSAFARTTSSGITGGDDDDQIGNTGEITVVASALNRSSSITVRSRRTLHRLRRHVSIAHLRPTSWSHRFKPSASRPVRGMMRL